MKRQITASKPTQFRAPNAPMSQAKEFADDIIAMIDLMAKRYKNQSILWLNQSTVKKFADAQVGNYATVFLKQSDRIIRKLLRQFDDKRILTMVKDSTEKVNKRNSKSLYESVEKTIGINRKELESTEGLTAQINAITLETYQWTRGLRDKTLQRWVSEILRKMAQGQDIETIINHLGEMVSADKRKAKFLARQQIAMFNSLTTKARAQNLGIEYAIWRTSKDERVRPCHVKREGLKFSLSEGLYSSCDDMWLLPGVDYRCRCIYELIINHE